ncbi:MAG: D-glycero-beta-D-manno-heptose-7-phosphate kinase [Limisphaerales bacterium]
MSQEPNIATARVKRLVNRFAKQRLLVVGDVMLDHFLWGKVSRISPEAPVPVVDFERESFMPGGAGNVARNVLGFGGNAELFGVIGNDPAARELKKILKHQQIGYGGLQASKSRQTSKKIRVVAHQQQVVRVDRETRDEIDGRIQKRILAALEEQLPAADALIVCDYGKGVVTQHLLDELRDRCRANAVWISLDPKPVHRLRLNDLSLITPNRKEVFALAGIEDETYNANPLKDKNLMAAARSLMMDLRPATMLITLSELGMLLCRRDEKPFHIPTMAQEVFDVSGAGDTVISAFTMAVAAGASPIEAAILSNHAAGVVVGKVGTATVEPKELIASFTTTK